MELFSKIPQRKLGARGLTVSAIGLGCMAMIRRAHQVHPISVIQSEYSLWERNLEEDIFPLLRLLGIGLVAFIPLGRGFLAGTAMRAESYPSSDFRYDDPCLKGGNFDKNMATAEVVREIAATQGATAA